MLAWLLKNWKILVVSAMVAALTLWVKSYVSLRQEKNRLEENEKALLMERESILTHFRATSDEMEDFINHMAPKLQEKLDSANIKIRNIQRVVVQKTVYVDTTTRTTDLDTILKTIQKGINTPATVLSAPIVDESPCLIIRGNVSFDGEHLELNITDREFSSVSEVVSHIQRRQWRLLGLIKTRFLGKRELKVTVFNSCGKSQTKILTKENGIWQEK